MALGVGVGPENTETPMGEGTPAGPRLLPGEAPAVAVAVADGAGTYPGQVAAGVGLGPALAPHLFPRGHWRQEALLLFGRAVLEQGGGQQEDAVLAHPLGRPGAVVLLLEDQPLHDADAAAAVRRGPTDHRPAILEEPALPGPVGGEAIGRVEGGEGIGRDVGGQTRLAPRPGTPLAPG